MPEFPPRRIYRHERYSRVKERDKYRDNYPERKSPPSSGRTIIKYMPDGTKQVIRSQR